MFVKNRVFLGKLLCRSVRRIRFVFIEFFFFFFDLCSDLCARNSSSNGVMKIVRMLNELYTTFDVLTDSRKNPNIYKVNQTNHSNNNRNTRTTSIRHQFPSLSYSVANRWEYLVCTAILPNARGAEPSSGRLLSYVWTDEIDRGTSALW